jgi:hypothetical protein
VTLAGCGQNDIQVYRVAKDQPQPQSQAQPAAVPAGHPDVSGGAAPRLQWKLPPGWEEAAPGEMRAASFRVKGDGGKQADVGVFPLPGMAGTDLDNVNRWRSQVSQPPVSAEELSKLAQPVQVAGQNAQLYEQAGTNPGSGEKTRILAAVLRRGDVAWFFKMTGDDALVAQQKPAFVEFLKSVSFPAAVAQTGLPPSHPPIGGAGAAPTAQTASVGAPGEGKPTWQVPPGWKEIPGGQFLVAKFMVSGADSSQAAVNVSMSAGTGGGLVGNINRWRTQLGLSQLPESDIARLVTTVDSDGGKVMLVDMAGTDPRTSQKSRLVGAIVPQPDRTWFYKLMGNEQVVAQEKGAFAKFVQTAKY